MTFLPLRLVKSPTNSEPSPQLSSVPFKTLPIVSLEEWRMRRLRTRLETLRDTSPIALVVLERWVDYLCEQEDAAQKMGALVFAVIGTATGLM